MTECPCTYKIHNEVYRETGAWGLWLTLNSDKRGKCVYMFVSVEGNTHTERRIREICQMSIGESK